MRAQFEDELAALPPQLAHLTAGEFIRTYGANLDRALQDVDREKRERVEREERERWDEQVERTVKKRCALVATQDARRWAVMLM